MSSASEARILIRNENSGGHQAGAFKNISGAPTRGRQAEWGCRNNAVDALMGDLADSLLDLPVFFC